MAERTFRRLAALLLLSLAALPAGAQEVLLELRPRQGDTLRVQMDQQVEMSGTGRIGNADTTVTMTSSMHVESRAIVLRSDAASVSVLSITDSVALASNVAPREMLEATRRALQGKQVRLRIAPDGTTDVDDGDSDNEQMRALFAQMPATLPRGPVKVGSRWTREMTMPSAGQSGGQKSGTMRTVFRLDSLTRRGEVAWISMRGEVTRDSAPELPPGATFAMNGTISGVIVIDRRRGWLSSSRAVVTVRSTMTPPTGEGTPMRFRMRVTQSMRVAER